MPEVLGRIELPFWPGALSPSLGAVFALNQAGDALEFVFQVPKSMQILRVGILQGTITGTAPTFKASLQGVTNGVPDGTIKGGGSPASVTFQPVSGGNNAFHWYTLANPYEATSGELLSLVIARDSGTIDGSNFATFRTTSNITPAPGLPYQISNENGTRTRNANTPIFGIGGGYEGEDLPYWYPLNTVANAAYNVDSTPDEKGTVFTIPEDWFGTYQVRGVAWYGAGTAGHTYDACLYLNGVLHLSATVDTDNDQAAASSRRREIIFPGPYPVIRAGDEVRITIKPTSAGGNIAVASFTVAAAGDMDAYTGGGDVAKGCTRTNGGAWTDDPLTRYGVNPILNNIEAESGFLFSPLGGGCVV